MPKTDTIAQQVLNDSESAELLKWMKSVQHVERDQALDLMHQGRLTKLHAEYYRRAVVGERFSEFKAKAEGRR